MSESSDGFKDWAVLELMGHRRLAGYVSEQTVAGAGLIRIDIPKGDEPLFENGYSTQFYHPNALYCLTPCSEEVARAFAKRSQPEPVHRWELPSAQPAARARDDDYPPEDEEGF